MEAQRGGFNARVFATLCNLPEVREALSAEGINIPEDTILQTEHKTTVDELEWIYVPELSKTAQEAFDCIETIMPNVSQHANRERLTQLPNFKTKIKIRVKRRIDLQKIGVKYVQNGD